MINIYFRQIIKIFCPMKQSSYFFISFIIITICFTGCKKDNLDCTLEGKWKLERVHMGISSFFPWHTITIDSLDYNIIYDFQKKNKLIVTSSISGNPQTNEYYYKCEKKHAFCASLDYDNIQFQIGKDKWDGSISQKYGIMSFSCGSTDSKTTAKPQQAIDIIDFILIEQDSLCFWQKSFIKLN